MTEPNALDVETEIVRMESERVCRDPRHETPCPLPCPVCEDECEIAA